jgi:RimJ/RimL family protein N-acetyltransferase
VARGRADIAWFLGLSWQHQGYATESAKALVDWLIHQLGVSEIRASIHPAHTASIGVAERLAMRRTAQCSGDELLWNLRFVE